MIGNFLPKENRMAKTKYLFFNYFGKGLQKCNDIIAAYNTEKCQYFRNQFRYRDGWCTNLYDAPASYEKIAMKTAMKKGGINFFNTDGEQYKSSSWSV